MTLGLPVAKAHAYGNDFLFVPSDCVTGDVAGLARRICHRHHGIGADGLILYTPSPAGARMQLWNADGSGSELSGNGLRCLAALIAARRHAAGPPLEAPDGSQEPPAGHQRLAGGYVTIDTAAGRKTLELLDRVGERYTFRAAMGSPQNIRRVLIPVAGETVAAIVLSVGNPQCVVLGALPDENRFRSLAPLLATHSMFPAGTNVEFVQVERPDCLRILIWERGVGITTSSGTGASASAVAAAAHGGAARVVDVVAPGGTQRVEWLEDSLYLTGWAEILFEGTWVGAV
jgi:diaminopimelate epimerase